MRTPPSELRSKVENAIKRLRALPKYKNQKRLPVTTVAKFAGIGRSTLNKHLALKDLCNSKDFANNSEPEIEFWSEEQKALNELIVHHEHYGEVILRMEDCLEETTKKIFDNYVQIKSEHSFKVESTKDSAALQRYISQLRVMNETLEQSLASERLLNRQPGKDSLQVGNNVTPFYRKFHISPDKFLMQGNEYVWDKKLASKAWAKARREFEKLVVLEQPDVIYLLCGPQNVGKTTWIKKHKPHRPGKHVYFDATLPTEQERVDLAYSAKDYCSTSELVIVRILASIETCLERQRLRGSQQYVPPHVIENTFKLFEEVSVDEPVDQIIVVRSESNVSDN